MYVMYVVYVIYVMYALYVMYVMYTYMEGSKGTFVYVCFVDASKDLSVELFSALLGVSRHQARDRTTYCSRSPAQAEMARP